MKRKLQSAILAIALMFGTTTAVTIGHSLVAPATAEAGILGKIGGAIKKTAKRVGGAAKTVGKGAVRAGKAVRGGISGVGRTAKRGAMRVSGAIAKNPVGRAVGKVGAKIGRRL